MRKIFEKNSITTNIIIIISMSILFMLLISAISFYNIKRTYDELSKKTDTFAYIYDIETKIRTIETYIEQVVNEDIEYNKEVEDIIHYSVEELDGLLDNVQSLNPEDNELKRRLNNFIPVYRSYLQSWSKLETYLKLKNKPLQGHVNILKNRDTELNTGIKNLMVYNKENTDFKYREIYNENVPLLVMAVVIPCIILIFFAIYISYSIRESVKGVFSVLTRLTEGSGLELDKANASNEFTEMKNVLAKTLIKQEDVKQLEKINYDLNKKVHDLKEAQERLIQKERLVSLGHLMGGIAHNLKTPIMAISGNISTLKCLSEEYKNSIDDNDVTSLDHHSIAKDMIKWIEKTRPMLDYMNNVIVSVMGHTIGFESNTIDSFKIDNLIEYIKILMDYELKKNNCKLQIKNNVSNKININGQVNALVQIVNNLIINSIHSYKGSEGVIKLNIKKLADKLLISVIDNGEGMNDDVKKCLFKQMITTKGKGGTGLGLYISYSTVKAQFGGEMWFESEFGNGTAFYLSIPLIGYRNK